MYVFFQGSDIIHVAFLDEKPDEDQQNKLLKLFNADRAQACMTWDIEDDADLLLEKYPYSHFA